MQAKRVFDVIALATVTFLRYTPTHSEGNERQLFGLITRVTLANVPQDVCPIFHKGIVSNVRVRLCACCHVLMC